MDSSDLSELPVLSPSFPTVSRQSADGHMNLSRKNLPSPIAHCPSPIAHRLLPISWWCTAAQLLSCFLLFTRTRVGIYNLVISWAAVQFISLMSVLYLLSPRYLTDIQSFICFSFRWLMAAQLYYNSPQILDNLHLEIHCNFGSEKYPFR